MKARTKFTKMYYKLPEKARTELVYNFTKHPMTLSVIMLEVSNNTKLSKKILKDLGYYDKFKGTCPNTEKICKKIREKNDI